jgi:hypothetical protein
LTLSPRRSNVKRSIDLWLLDAYSIDCLNKS